MIRVQDCNGRQITVGCSVLYGSPELHERDAHTAEVFAISEPDVVYNSVTDADDGGYAVSIGIRFADGETDTFNANVVSSAAAAAWESGDDSGLVFEEAGDLEVIETNGGGNDA